MYCYNKKLSFEKITFAVNFWANLKNMNELGEGDIDIIKAPIVIDNGSGIMKAGLGGESEPSLVFNS